MDGRRLNALIQRGHAKAARHIGLPHKVYRPVRRRRPIELLAQRPDIIAAFSPKSDFEFKTPSTSKDQVFSMACDDPGLKHGDYVIGETGTYFVSETGHLTAPVCVMCNHTLSLRRMEKPNQFGVLKYQSETSGEEVVLASLPGSLTRTSQGGRYEAGLPGNQSAPEVLILWPDLSLLAGPDGMDPAINPVNQGWKEDDYVIRTSDIITDDLNRRWGVVAVELSKFGWKIWCRMLGTG